MKTVEDKLQVVNRALSVVEQSDGSPPVVHVNSAPGIGIVWITEQAFEYGTIEFDGRGKDLFQKSFVGVAFHGVDDDTYEAVYLRPFNFRAADPDRKLHAVQYMAMPSYDWPRLRKEFPDQYEKPVIPEPDPGEWFHVKIEVASNKVRVFVNHHDSPVLEVTPLVQLKGKKIGYWVGHESDGDWKNLVVQPSH
jgi:hypothetical protein